ncbi:probable E3 SUMO-protein ligase RNF212 isoform X3 [Gambusia affinis]|uniref:probable E3 SUMO-protein ligase RNF212 isoform X3 n=1 Tax=Gambusia affinis TaxID=33528 RepID=UPI001CDD6BA7|nr:probable E3 SUMO-protein ligase RNF212 isoform X3 [Gambusia affinis]
MSYWVCCNSCFLCPSPERKLAVTSCGHVICSACYHKGSHGRCLICSSQCQVSPLSDKSSSDVKALFSDIGVVATRHLAEISKVVAFQARHQKRLLNYYKQKNHKLEDMLVSIKQEMQQMGKKLNDQRAYIAKLENSLQHHSSSTHTPHGSKSVLQIPYESPVFLPRHASATNIQSLELEDSSLFRKPVSAPRPSVMKALPEGRPGPATHWSYSQNPLTSHSAHSATVSRFSPSTPESYGQSSAWKFKAPSSFSRSASFLGFPPP